MAPRRIRELHVADFGQVLFDRGSQVAFHDLHVIDVVLEQQIRQVGVMHDVEGLARIIQIEPGDVARIDGFDEQLQVLFCEFLAGELQVGDVSLAHLVFADAARLEAGHAVDLGGAQRLCIFQRLADGVLELPDLGRIARQATVAAGEIARRHVEKHHLQLVLVEPLANLCRGKIIGKQKLDSAESGFRRGAEAVQKADLVEHHRQVGVEFRHASSRDFLVSGWRER